MKKFAASFIIALFSTTAFAVAISEGDCMYNCGVEKIAKKTCDKICKA